MTTTKVLLFDGDRQSPLWGFKTMPDFPYSAENERLLLNTNLLMTVDLNEKFECTVDFNKSPLVNNVLAEAFIFNQPMKGRVVIRKKGANPSLDDTEISEIKNSTDIVSVRLEVGAINLFAKK